MCSLSPAATAAELRGKLTTKGLGITRLNGEVDKKVGTSTPASLSALRFSEISPDKPNL